MDREQELGRLAALIERRLGQTLSLLLEQMNAYRAAGMLSPAQASNALSTLSGMTSHLWTELQDLVADLEANELCDLGLAPALETLALRTERRYGMPVSLDLDDLESDIPPAVALAAYRIAQEALDNAGQHAGAGRVGISLRQERGRLVLTVADDGQGFRVSPAVESYVQQGQYGLAEESQRATDMSGRLEVSSVLGVGTQVRIWLPLHPAAASPTPSQADGSSHAESLIEPLTPREQEVLAGVAQGWTNRQIAAHLGISDRTVQFHLGNVLGKLNVASRTEAAVLALERGLV
jgi:signal transduction histidine kinase/DNA-binding CsgD family transcriptional regulator